MEPTETTETTKPSQEVGTPKHFRRFVVHYPESSELTNREIALAWYTGKAEDWLTNETDVDSLFPNWDDYLNVGGLAEEYDLTKEDVYKCIQTTPIVMYRSKGTPLREGKYVDGSFNWNVTPRSIILHFRDIPATVEKVYNKVLFQTWESWVHEITHALTQWKDDEAAEEKEHELRSEEVEKDVPYPYLDTENASVLAEILAMEDAGMSYDRMVKEIKNLWGNKMDNDQIDQLIEQAHSRREGSYRKLSVEYPKAEELTNKEMVTKALNSEIHTTADELFPNWRDNMFTGMLSNNYGLTYDEIMECAEKTLITMRFNPTLAPHYGDVEVEGWFYWKGDKGNRNIVLEIVVFEDRPSQDDIDKICVDAWEAWQHEVTHSMIGWLLDNKGEKIMHQRNRDVEQKKNPKYPYLPVERETCLITILSWEDDGLSKDDIIAEAESWWKLTRDEAIKLIADAHKRIQGSYRKFALIEMGDKGLIPSMLKKSKESGIVVHHTFNSIAECFPTWNEYLDWRTIAHEHEVSMSDIKALIEGRITLEIMGGWIEKGVTSVPRFEEQPMRISMNGLTHVLSKIISIVFGFEPNVGVPKGQLAQKDIDEFNSAMWDTVLHEIIHVVQDLNESRDVYQQHMDEYEAEIAKHQENPHNQIAYPYIGEEHEPVVEEILALEDRGFSPEKVVKYIMKQWTTTREQAEELVEDAHLRKEGSYRKLSGTIMVNEKVLQTLMERLQGRISKKSGDYTVKGTYKIDMLFPSWRKYPEWERMSREHFNGKTEEMFDVISGTLVHVELGYIIPSMTFSEYSTDGYAGYNPLSVFLQVSLPVGVFNIYDTLRTAAEELWEVFVHEVTHVLDFATKTSKEIENDIKKYRKLEKEEPEFNVEKAPRTHKHPWLPGEMNSVLEEIVEMRYAKKTDEQIVKRIKGLWGLTDAEAWELIGTADIMRHGSYRKLSGKVVRKKMKVVEAMLV